MPGARWVGHMTWRDLLFAHWPVAAQDLRVHVPASIEIDEFDGSAWLAVVPFEMTDMYVRGLPPLPGLSRTLELNVRTYVRLNGVSGVYFFSLDASSLPAVIGARAVYHLNYLHARMSIKRDVDRVAYVSRRIHRGAPRAEFQGEYWPAGPVYVSVPGSLEYWLTERYALFADDSKGRLYRTDIQHARWPLQRAEASFELNTMAAGLDVKIASSKPLLHFAKELDVVVWRPRRLR